MVDDAHGFGTLGKTGAGAGEEQGVQDEIDVYLATFAKSMAGIGAFVAADKEIIEYLKYNLRSQMFAKSLPMVYYFWFWYLYILIWCCPDIMWYFFGMFCLPFSKEKG